MIFGNLEGLINGTESVVFDYEVTGSAVSSISTGNILNGNEDGWYTIIVRNCADGASAGNSMQVRFNNDSGANYGDRHIYANNTTVSNTTWANGYGAGSAGNRISYVQSAQPSFGVMRLYAKSGSVRLSNTVFAGQISGTTVNYLMCIGGVWNNSTDNITNMTFIQEPGSGNVGVGTRIIILKANNFTNGTPTGSITTPYIKGSWVRVGSTILGSAASSVTFSGLDGDRDVIYSLSYHVKGSGDIDSLNVRFGNPTIDTGTNYGYQVVYGGNTTVGASRGPAGYILQGNCVGNGVYMSSQNLIFAKQGFVRPVLTSCVENVSGTTIGYTRIAGSVWNTSSGNLQTIEIKPYQNNFDIGSQFDLYALRPNG